MDSFTYIDTRDKKCFKHAFDLTIKNGAWLKVTLFLFLLSFIPIIGVFWALGYVLEWNRLTSWGVASSPRIQGMNIGGCIGTGFRSFVIFCAYFLGFIAMVVLINPVLMLGGIVEVLSSIVLIFLFLYVGLLSDIAMVRSAIYQRIAPGFQVTKILEMARRDKKGFWKLLLFRGLRYLITFLLVSSIYGAVLYSVMGPQLLQINPASAMDLEYVYNILMLATKDSISLAAMVSLPNIFLVVLFMNMVSVWFIQFDVFRWGDYKQDLPDQVVYIEASAQDENLEQKPSQDEVQEIDEP